MRDEEREWREAAVLARGKQWVRDCPIVSQQMRSKAQNKHVHASAQPSGYCVKAASFILSPWYGMSCDVTTERTAVSMPPKENSKKIRIFRQRARYHTSTMAEVTTASHLWAEPWWFKDFLSQDYHVFLNAYLDQMKTVYWLLHPNSWKQSLFYGICRNTNIIALNKETVF